MPWKVLSSPNSPLQLMRMAIVAASVLKLSVRVTWQSLKVAAVIGMTWIALPDGLISSNPAGLRTEPVSTVEDRPCRSLC